MKRLLLLLLAAGLTLSACKKTEPAPEDPQTEQPEEEVFQIVPAPIEGIASPVAGATPQTSVEAERYTGSIQWYDADEKPIGAAYSQKTYQFDMAYHAAIALVFHSPEVPKPTFPTFLDFAHVSPYRYLHDDRVTNHINIKLAEFAYKLNSGLGFPKPDAAGEDDTTFSGIYEGSLFIYNPNFEVNN